METQMAGSISRLDGNKSQMRLLRIFWPTKRFWRICGARRVRSFKYWKKNMISHAQHGRTVTAVCNPSQGFIEEGRERGNERGPRERHERGAARKARIRSGCGAFAVLWKPLAGRWTKSWPP